MTVEVEPCTHGKLRDSPSCSKISTTSHYRELPNLHSRQECNSYRFSLGSSSRLRSIYSLKGESKIESPTSYHRSSSFFEQHLYKNSSYSCKNSDRTMFCSVDSATAHGPWNPWRVPGLLPHIEMSSSPQCIIVDKQYPSLEVNFGFNMRFREARFVKSRHNLRHRRREIH